MPTVFFLFRPPIPAQNNRDPAKDLRILENDHNDFPILKFFGIFCVKQRMEGYEEKREERGGGEITLRRAVMRCAVSAVRSR